MARTSKGSAEAQLEKLKQRDSDVFRERQLAERARDEKVARLRALRLAKEDADRKEALAAKVKSPGRASERRKKVKAAGA
jgi:hypothetical protein